MVVLVGLLAMVPSVWADAPPGSKMIAATTCAGGLLFFAGLCAWGLRGALRHELHVSDQAVEARGLGRPRRIVLDEVREARWGCLGDARRLTLDAQPNKLKIDFLLYDRRARRELIRFFRLRIPEARQRNWWRFWATSWRLFDEPGPADTDWLAEKASLRMRLGLVFYVGAMVLVPLGIAIWWWTKEPWILAILAILLPLWPMCHFARPPRGKVARLRLRNKESARIAEQEYLGRSGNPA